MCSGFTKASTLNSTKAKLDSDSDEPVTMLFNFFLTVPSQLTHELFKFFWSIINLLYLQIPHQFQRKHTSCYGNSARVFTLDVLLSN